MAEDTKPTENTQAEQWSETPAPGLEDTSLHDDEGESAPSPAPTPGIPSPDAAPSDPLSAGAEENSGPTPPADAPAAEPETPETPEAEPEASEPAPTDPTPSPDDSTPADEAEPLSGLNAAVATEAEGVPESEVAPAEVAPATPPAAPAKPEAPKLGDVRQEVSDLNDLPASALDTLREGGCALFLFLADMADVESDGLSQEAKARLSNVRDSTVRLLSAIESVFVRHG